MSRGYRFILPLILIVGVYVAWSMTSGDRLPHHPDPSLSPQDVVEIQLDALRHNNDPSQDHGVAIAYRFASPANRSITGPLAHFASLLHTNYSDMLHWIKVKYAPTIFYEGKALQRVILLTVDHRKVEYLFILSKQARPPHRNCWMTDSVIKPPPPTAPPIQTPLKPHPV